MSAGITFRDEVPEEALSEGKYASQLPDPVGFSMLLSLPEADEKTKGGIVIPEERRTAEKAASVVAMVVKQGPECYKREGHFPSGPWCKEGDWVVIRSYAGTRVMVQGKEFRIINDDGIEAVVEDPTGIYRVGG